MAAESPGARRWQFQRDLAAMRVKYPRRERGLLSHRQRELLIKMADDLRNQFNASRLSLEHVGKAFERIAQAHGAPAKLSAVQKKEASL